MRTRAPLAALGLALALSAQACSSCNEKALETPPDGGVTTTLLTPEQAARVLAKVGDRTITLGDYVAALEHMDQFARLRYQSPERRKELLNEMINVALLAREAKAKGYDKEPRAEQEARAVLRDAMLEQARKGLASPGEIPEADVKAYFDAHKADFRDAERRRISVLVTKDEAAAKDALDAWKKSGATAGQWADLVRKRSIDPRAKDNLTSDLAGDVGVVTPPSDTRGENTKVSPEVRAAAFEIAKVGDVLDRVVSSGDKFYLVRLREKTDARDRTYPEAERTIRVKLAQDRLRAKEDELLNQLRAEFPVQIDEKALAAVKVEPSDSRGDAAAPENAASSLDAGKD